MSEIKVYGLDSSLIHDADPKDGFVVDVVRFNDYVELEKKYQALVGENAAAIEAVRIFSNATEQLTEIIGDEIGMDGVSKLLHGFSIVGSMPATTQALNEIKAQGIEEYGNLTINIGQDENCEEVIYAGKQALLFAASLRGEHEIKS
ncbi:TPA: hypothetical protein PXI74_004455 [Yersinia enterocolitica]|uniref:hypothetical protein n=1 Tax=Yersinia enterocolitica TaxID=630 RepID=UPI0005E7CD28|nr:hypothetical protein [Yersinia enterocolitica]CFB71062.1 Uncharacterised protein [Yersinia enterocolitica]HDL6481056.1 hypothetical protein [Yersinia enterocolitica]HDL8289228.1 hypothetical protein [Yersinia enterocolitica]HEM6608174.1 hypothetical protein [Yersinia enterocolitica]HEN3518926.1 hypothetical protein [Yersinia enterocolitica]